MDAGRHVCTRMDYLAPLFQETAYCLAVEKLLGITDDVPERASVIRVLMMELNRIASHLVCLGTGGNEMGATTVMTIAFTAREEILRIFEAVTGLRMNHAYVRPGGVAQDVPPDLVEQVRRADPLGAATSASSATSCSPTPSSRGASRGRAPQPRGLHGARRHRTGAALDGPPVRRAQDRPVLRLRDVRLRRPDRDGRRLLRPRRAAAQECYQSLHIVAQCLDRLEATAGQPVMVGDRKIAWPAQLAIGSDGQGNSLEHIKEIMGSSMEALIHHFKLVTEGFRVPVGQAWQTVEHPRGELGVHLVSDGGTRPYRAHFRDPSFNNLQAVAAMCEGGQVADVVVAVASLDPVLGGVDR